MRKKKTPYAILTRQKANIFENGDINELNKLREKQIALEKTQVPIRINSNTIVLRDPNKKRKYA